MSEDNEPYNEGRDPLLCELDNKVLYNKYTDNDNELALFRHTIGIYVLDRFMTSIQHDRMVTHF